MTADALTKPERNCSRQQGRAVREAVMAELRQTFRPEFLNRVDDAIVFRRLTPADVRRIAAAGARQEHPHG